LTYSTGHYLPALDGRLFGEQIESRPEPSEFSDKSKDPLDNFFQAKRVNLVRSVEEISDLIDHRERIRERNLYAIALGECELLTKLHNLEPWYLGTDPVIDKRKAVLERELLEFDRQKRIEVTSAWKDVLTLKGELRSFTQDLYKEQSKQQLFSYGGI
jgi:hypothetical protein